MDTPRDNQQNVDTPDVPATSQDTPDRDRRRFIIAGIAAAPLLVTLTARPAEARQGQGSLGNYGSSN